MKGRWTIWLTPEGEVELDIHAIPGKDTEVPVVPCDDAAVERASRAVVALLRDDPAAPGWTIAEAVLRAAGETP